MDLVITFFNISDLKEVEIKLHQTEQMNRFLLNSSSDIIVKLSTDRKILEYNPEAEKYFGKKRKDAVNQNFIQMFIPEALRNKIENNLKKMLKEVLDGKFKMQVIAAGDKIQDVIWSVHIIHNKLNIAEEIVLSLKK